MTSTILVLILVPAFYCILDILFKIGPRSEQSTTKELERSISEATVVS